jgi:hypothetical protein
VINSIVIRISHTMANNQIDPQPLNGRTRDGLVIKTSLSMKLIVAITLTTVEPIITRPSDLILSNFTNLLSTTNRLNVDLDPLVSDLVTLAKSMQPPSRSAFSFGNLCW